MIPQIYDLVGRTYSANACESSFIKKTSKFYIWLAELTQRTYVSRVSFNLKINDNLIEYLSSEEAPIRGASSFLVQKFKFGRMKLNIAI